MAFGAQVQGVRGHPQEAPAAVASACPSIDTKPRGWRSQGVLEGPLLAASVRLVIAWNDNSMRPQKHNVSA